MEILHAAYLVLNQSDTLWSSGQSDWSLFGGRLNRKLISGSRSSKGIESSGFWFLCRQSRTRWWLLERKLKRIRPRKSQEKENSIVLGQNGDWKHLECKTRNWKSCSLAFQIPTIAPLGLWSWMLVFKRPWTSHQCWQWHLQWVICMMALFYFQDQNALSNCFLIEICLLSWEWRDNWEN